MTGRGIAATMTVILFAAGCTTTTAHRLVLIDNPLREQALACEASCRRGATVKHTCTSLEGPECNGTAVDSHRYASCLDTCPGARATDGASCPTPDPGAICVETTKANPGGIVGGVVATGAIGLLIIVILAVGAFFAALAAAV